MNIFINSRFYEEMEDVSKAKGEMAEKLRLREESGRTPRREVKPVVMNEAFNFYNHYFSLGHHD